MLRLLLTANVRVAFLRDCDNHTALDVAMGNRHPACVQLLVQDIIRRQVCDSSLAFCSLGELLLDVEAYAFVFMLLSRMVLCVFPHRT